MKVKHLLISLALGLGLSLILVGMLGIWSGPAVAAPVLSQVEGPRTVYVEAPLAPTAELHVCATCGYTTIQDAVDAAGGGDIIKVAAGVYNDVHARADVIQVVYISKTVTIQGGYTTGDWVNPNPKVNLTTLDAQGQGRVLYITGDVYPTIEGLQITGGDATGMGGGPWSYDGTGGGVYVFSATATISNCAIYGNIAGRNGWGGGGGVYLWLSPATLINNNIYSNTAGMSTTVGLSGEGGGVAMSGGEAVLIDNVIQDNAASSVAFGLGGGVYMEASSTLRNNIVQDNAASRSGRGWGGGIFSGYYDESLLVNTVLIGNFSGVTADSLGAGVIVEMASPRLLHTTLQNNTGGDGSGIHVRSESTIVLTNTILVNQTVGVTVTGDSTATLNGVLWYNNDANTGGTGGVNVTSEFTGTPAFATDGYHLTEGSSAIDRDVVDAGVTDDVDGQARPYNGLPDLGADEWYPSSCIALESVGIDGPAMGVTDTLYIFHAVITPTDASPVTYTWSPQPEIGQGTNQPTYKFAEIGVSIITLTAENCGGGVFSATHTITIKSSVVEEYVHTISPVYKNDPCVSVYTITNQGAGTATLVHEFYDTGDRQVHVFTDTVGAGVSQGYDLAEIAAIPPGSYGGYVVVTADQPFTYTLAPCPGCIPLTSVEIAGPATGQTDIPYTFSAIISPTEATQPISYIWSPEPDSGQGTAGVNYAWPYPVAKMIRVTAENCSGLASATDKHVIRVGAVSTVDPGITTTVTYTNEEGYTTTLEFPPGAVDAPTIITYTPLISPVHPISVDLRFAGLAFDLDASQDDSDKGPLSFIFLRPVTLTIHYSDEDVFGIDEETLRLYRWIELLERWRKVGDSIIPGEDQWLDTERNVLGARLWRFSRFTSAGVSHPIFLPLVLRNY